MPVAPIDAGDAGHAGGAGRAAGRRRPGRTGRLGRGRCASPGTGRGRPRRAVRTRSRPWLPRTATPIEIGDADDRVRGEHLDHAGAAADPLGDLARLGRAGGGEQDDELLAAEPADQVGLADLLAHLGGQRPQHGVAGEVAVGVVDHLEVVDVGEQQRRAARGAAAPGRSRASASPCQAPAFSTPVFGSVRACALSCECSRLRWSRITGGSATTSRMALSAQAIVTRMPTQVSVRSSSIRSRSQSMSASRASGSASQAAIATRQVFSTMKATAQPTATPGLLRAHQPRVRPRVGQPVGRLALRRRGEPAEQDRGARAGQAERRAC